VPDVLERTPQVAAPPPPSLPLKPRTVPSERPARSQLLEQIAKLETELSQLFVSAFPRQGLEYGVRSRGGPRLLTLAELEALRDDLAERLRHVRLTLSERTYVEECNRREIEEMLLYPEQHKWERISAEDIGERGCKHWHVRPRGGLIGMLLGWWRVVVSSGCPLIRGRGGEP
jgi:hypothetical protein